jgi:hypothetical protein
MEMSLLSLLTNCCECKSTMGRLLWIIMAAIVIAEMVYEVDLKLNDEKCNKISCNRGIVRSVLEKHV